MKRRINIQLLILGAIAIICTLCLSVTVFYDHFKTQVKEDLRSYAVFLSFMDTEQMEKLAEKQGNVDNLRITVIESDGTVSFDSQVDIKRLDNHKARPEFEEASKNGSGSIIRKSDTLSQSVFYYALRLENGQILRVSKETSSIFSVFYHMIPVLLLMGGLIFILCMVIARYLARSIISPIKHLAMNLQNPKKEMIYKELVPFTEMIQEQHRNILKNAKMRQEFTANVSHELKTPLTAISGYAELIENGMANGQDVKRFSMEIHRNANRLLTIINDTIRLSELDDNELSVTTEPIDLYNLALSCIKTLAINAEKNQVTIEVKGSHNIIEANKQMMEELIFNLCDNAIRYNNIGGIVTVTVEDIKGRTLLSVKDTGIGIPKKHQERVFERFYRVDKSRSKSTGGTGLGLAIVKHIVAQHNAQLNLISEEGKGTEITVLF